MTALATAHVIGVATGAAPTGQLVDVHSPDAGLLVVSVAGLLVVVGGIGTRLRPIGDDDCRGWPR